MTRRSYSPFPGRVHVLRALKDAGVWTPRDLFAWARANGGSEPTYAALHYYTRKGLVSYTPNRWEAKR